MEQHLERHIGDILKERNIEIVGADLATRHGFTQVPNFILTNKDISVGAKLAYAMLLKYAWSNDACFPGQTKLAEDMGSGERSVRRYLEELEKVALLRIVQRGLGKTNLLPAIPHRPQGSHWPTLTGQIGRSGPAILAGLERPNLPLIQYKNTHVRILTLKIRSEELHF